MTPAERYRFAHLRRDLAADIEAYLDFAAEYGPDRRTFAKRLSAALMPSVLACLLYRLSHLAHSAGHRRIAGALVWLNLVATGTAIAPASRIGAGLYIPHPSTGVVFEGSAGRNLRLFAGSAAGPGFTPLNCGALGAAPRFGDDVSLGAKAWVHGPVVVGSGARIGFNAVVTRDVADGARVSSVHVRDRARPAAQAPSR
jgi:serine O-acetyltransferase